MLNHLVFVFLFVFSGGISSTQVSHLKPPNTAYFSPDSSEVEGFSIPDLKETIKEYPGICIQFTLYQLKGDSRTLGKKRIAAFRKLLDENQVSNKNYTISRELFTRAPAIDSATGVERRAAIEGIVLSIHEPCKE